MSITRLIRSLALLLAIAVVVAGVRPAVAQEGTPALGDAVTVYDEQLNELATITVTEYLDPFEDYDQEFYSPDRGERVTALQIEVEVIGDAAIDVSDFDIALQDDSGFLWGSGYVPLPEDGDLTEFEGDNLAPGDTASGVIGFLVPDDAEILRILYLPSSPTRLYILADLQDGAATGGDDADDATDDEATPDEDAEDAEDTDEGAPADDDATDDSDDADTGDDSTPEA